MPLVVAEKLKSRVAMVDGDLQREEPLFFIFTVRCPDFFGDLTEQQATESTSESMSGRQGTRPTERLDGTPSRAEPQSEPDLREGDSPQPGQLTEGSCSRVLQMRCPACFGGTRFGRDFDT